MGEIDTKPFESVQAALSLFGEKNDQRKYRSNSCEGKELVEKELDLMLKDLANYKVRLEVKESTYKQALLKLEKYQKTVDELSSKLKNSEAERDKYIEECGEARNRIEELESKIKDLSDKLLESGKAQEQLLDVVNELKAAQEELHTTKAELTATEESKVVATKHAELMEIAVDMEKEKTEELLKHITELNEANHLLKLAAIVADKENSMLLSEKEDAIQMATEASVQADAHLEEMRKQTEMMQELENQLSAKTMFIDSIQWELKQVKESHNSSLQATSDALNNINQLKSELEPSERLNADQAIYVRSMETEVIQLKLGLKNADEEVSRLTGRLKMLTGEIQKLKGERDEIRSRESEEQVEIALLKSELHRQRSKIAAAEAAEARAMSVKSELYLAVQQLTLEADDAKKEAQRLKQEAEETENSKSTHFTDLTQELEQTEVDESETKSKERKDGTDTQITISIQEYESLIQKAEKADQIAVSPTEVGLDVSTFNSENELNALKKKLEISMAEIWELKCSVEQAVNRAVQAERAKSAVEDQLRKWRESKQRRRTALAALEEESSLKGSNSARYEKAPSMYQPLGKVLNMKF